ncbi:MAG: MGDG synthase family glycosyltransferase [Acidimicrobiia bacterium]
MTQRILIISASMGAGHDGAARELKRRLEDDGHFAEIIDYLEQAPLRLLHLVRRTYEAQLRFAPWSYHLTYQLWLFMPFLYGPLVGINSLLARRRIKRAIDRVQPSVVVSTYCLATLVLGRMRRKRWLRVPAVTYLTDFAVHPLCVHPGIDLTLAVSPQSAVAALENRATAVASPGPLVPERFTAGAVHRTATRDRHNIPDQIVALVVAGSWGVGEVVETVEALAAIDGVHPVTVCGRDDALRDELVARGIGTVVGWTNEMDQLMGAADIVVENAGGLTCMEAFRAGVPVITYRPIPGHGRDNAQHMMQAGVTRFVEDDECLASVIHALRPGGIEREEQVARASALFAGDAAAEVCSVAQRAPHTVVQFRRPRGPRIVRAVATFVLIGYGALTLGAQAATARGIGVARPTRGVGNVAYVGVRLDGEQLNDPKVIAAVSAVNATAIIDAKTAAANGAALERLRAAGVAVANGGWGRGDRFRWNRARSDVSRSGAVLATSATQVPEVFAPGRRIDGFDLWLSRRNHTRVVRADDVIRANETDATLRAGKVYIVDGRGGSCAQLLANLQELQTRAQPANLQLAPLQDLS